MSRTKCLIVDDEPLAIEVLKSHIQKLDSLEIVGTCADAIEAFDFLKSHEVDLVFLDINMPEMKGTDLVKTLKNPPAIVFTTAYREYAIESYDLNVLDYLLKPISFERFLQAVEKYNQQNVLIEEVTLHKNNGDSECIYLREKNVIHKIPVIEILYVESFGDYMKLHTTDREINSRCTMAALEKALPEKAFVRVHRSFLIAINKVTSFSPVMVAIGDKEFPIGTRYREKTFDKLDFNSFLNK
ncbi:LytTR family DNA-binding domain-containing protein [Draconibacterium sp. IB214405]|uniref:LytR/AlgR family response regulator transcription factor n=1 Tax=Draconibacterium sp. IB214405 TaxID=3097352 RepID=UPI002A0BC1AB|nr:LytTR family DNA-binding domain-containing protein [Draconibacterium sp. IB214405]MDX8341229.1 LytTR family DNA-binding domain-containing protein [Draconibacterium sp. IB214405]